MLTLFILTCLCSFIFNSEIELKSNSLNLNQSGVTSTSNSLAEFTRQRFRSRNSTLRPGESLYSKNGKYILTMQASTCRLVLKETEGKVLFRSQELKAMSGCKAVLKRNSNFAVVNKKRAVVWSTKTAKSQRGKGPFRLQINAKGNVIVRNRTKQCVWALFGCPVPKKFINKIQKMKPSDAASLLQKRMKKLKKQFNGLPIKPLPRARGKPEIKNQTPVYLNKKKPKNMKPVTLIPKNKLNGIKDLINDGPVKGSNWQNVRNILKGKVKPNQLRQLKNLISTGNNSYGDIKKQALRKISIRLKAISSSENRKPRKPKTAPKVNTKSQLINQIKKQPWFVNVRKAIQARAPIRHIRKLIKTSGNVRGNTSYWRQVTNAIKRNNVQRIVRLVSLPVRRPVVWVRPVYYPPRRRWVLRYRSYITWRWSYYWSRYWAYHCWGWWWWRRCGWCNHWGGWVWYRYYYWTGYYYWSYE